MDALKIHTRVEENGNDVEAVIELEALKQELSRLKLDVSSILREKSGAEKEVKELRIKMEGNLRLLKSLEKEIEVANEEHWLAELGKMEALMEYKEIERQREGKEKEVLDLLVERNKRIKELLEEAERSKDIEKELFETTSDVEMLETQLKLVKKMERRDSSMYSLKEAVEAKKEELASVNAQLFRLMAVMDTLRTEILEIKEGTARFNKILRKDDVKIQKLNSKMLMAKTNFELVLRAEERVRSLADNLAGSLDKLKKGREAAKKEELLLKQEKTVTEVETQETKLEVDEKERELISKLDELENAKLTEALVLEKLESLVEKTMESREKGTERCSTITISRFEYEYLSRHASQAEETAEKKVAAAEAWVEALKASTKAVLMKTETLMRDSGMPREEEEREACRTRKTVVESEIQNPQAQNYLSPKLVGKLTPGKYSSAGTRLSL